MRASVGHASARLFAVLVLSTWCPGWTSAQWLTSPSPHFGAITIPENSVAPYLGMTVDRFTPNGKVTEPGVYNGIDQTIGFNFLTYSAAARSTRWPGLIYRTTLQLGWGHDQPTAWIQNKLHRLANLPPVVGVNPRNNVLDAAFSLELVHWAPLTGNIERFLGGGLTTGTPYTEGWLQVGVASLLGDSWPEVSGMVRIGAPLLGGAFPDSTLATAYGAVEAMIEIPLAAWLGAEWLPTPFIAVRQDTGFFTDLSGAGIAELHGSIGLAGRNDSWRFEAWNEYFGGQPKDRGPTGGGRLYLKVPGMNLLGWIS